MSVTRLRNPKSFISTASKRKRKYRAGKIGAFPLYREVLGTTPEKLMAATIFRLAARSTLLRGPLTAAIRTRAAPAITNYAIRNCAHKAAMDAIANAERSAGELEAAEKAAAKADTEAPAASTPQPAATSRVPPRFPIGAEVECRLGPDRWSLGTIVGLHYREKGWPPEKRAPYQVRLKLTDSQLLKNGGKEMLIYAPEDVDECVRSTLRFGVGSHVECFLEDEGWRHGVVVATYHKEPSWEPGKWAPYQINLDGGLLIYAPEYDDACIRAPPSWPWPGAPRPND